MIQHSILILDRMDQPNIGTFLEIKSRTWSLRDAEHKAEMTRALIETLGASPEEIVREDYVEFIETRSLIECFCGVESIPLELLTSP